MEYLQDLRTFWITTLMLLLMIIITMINLTKLQLLSLLTLQTLPIINLLNTTNKHLPKANGNGSGYGILKVTILTLSYLRDTTGQIFIKKPNLVKDS